MKQPILIMITKHQSNYQKGHSYKFNPGKNVCHVKYD